MSSDKFKIDTDENGRDAFIQFCHKTAHLPDDHSHPKDVRRNEQVLDIIVLGETWNILRIKEERDPSMDEDPSQDFADSLDTIYEFKVNLENKEELLAYRLKELEGYTYLYEIMIAKTEEKIFLSAICVSNYNITGNKKSPKQVDESRLCQRFVDLLKQVIRDNPPVEDLYIEEQEPSPSDGLETVADQLDSLSLHETLTVDNLDSHWPYAVNFIKQKWMSYGNDFAKKLQEFSKQKNECFPRACKWYFVTKAFNQVEDRIQCNQTIPPSLPASIRTELAIRISIHIGICQLAPGFSLCFNKNLLKSYGLEEGDGRWDSKQICMLPNAYDITVNKVPVNSFNICHVKHFSWHMRHSADHSKLWWLRENEKIAEKFKCVYDRKCRKKKISPKQLESLEDHFSNVLLTFKPLIVNMWSSSGVQSVFVWTKELDPSAPALFNHVHEAFQNLAAFCESFACLHSINVTRISEEEFTAYSNNIAKPLVATIQFLNLLVFDFVKDKFVKTFRFPPNIFEDCDVAETLLKRYFNGFFYPDGIWLEDSLINNTTMVDEEGNDIWPYNERYFFKKNEMISKR